MTVWSRAGHATNATSTWSRSTAPTAAPIACASLDPPNPAELSLEIKIEELERWLLANRSVPEDMLFARIEALVGRRISPHELDDPDTLIRRAQRPGRQYDWDDW